MKWSDERWSVGIRNGTEPRRADRRSHFRPKRRFLVWPEGLICWIGRGVGTTYGVAIQDSHTRFRPDDCLLRRAPGANRGALGDDRKILQDKHDQVRSADDAHELSTFNDGDPSEAAVGQALTDI